MADRSDTPTRRRPLTAAPLPDPDPLRRDGVPPHLKVRRSSQPGGQAFSWVAGTIFVVATIVAAGSAWLASFANSYCGDAPSARQVHDLRVSYAVIGGLWLVVPLITASAARARGRDATPWVWLACLGGLITGLAAISAEPTHWCLF